MSANMLHRSFAGGEITPELRGRLDLSKYQTGAALIRNARVRPHGPIDRRPGLRFSAEAADSARRVRMIPFAFSADQTFALEFGHQYVRFHTQGQLLLDPNLTVVAFTSDSVTVAAPHGWATGDEVLVAGRLWLADVTSAVSARLEDRWGRAPAFTSPPGAAARVYQLATPYTEDDLFDLAYAQDSDVLTITSLQHATRELRRLGPAQWELVALSFAPTLAPPSLLIASAIISGTPAVSPHTYVVTAVGADGVTESLASMSATASNNLAIAGNYNIVTWIPNGSPRYNVYKQRGGAFGFIAQVSNDIINDDNVLPDTTRTPPEDFIKLNDAPDRYPAAVAYYEQRRWFGGSLESPQTVWCTRSGTTSNITSSVPQQDDDAMQFRVASQKQNAIRYLLPLQDLIALTAGGEFRIFSDNAPNITPSTLSVKAQGYSGAAKVQPALTNGSILYVQDGSSHVRELAYNWQSNAYASLDLSIMAPHLVNGKSIVDVAFAMAAEPVLWCVRSDGVLLGLTYVPEHQVYAWHQHDTDGLVESVCTIREGREDVVYCCVQRTIDGRQVRYVERMAPVFFGDLPQAMFLDAAATYQGAPVSALSNLWHLEGRTVHLLADGGVHPPVVVEDGRVELGAPASIVHVGLPYTTQLQTLPISFESAPAGGQGSTKNINAVEIRVSRTNVVKAGPAFDQLVSYQDRDVDDLYGSPPALRTEPLRFEIPPDWNAEGMLCVQQDLLLPLTVLSIAVDVTPGG